MLIFRSIVCLFFATCNFALDFESRNFQVKDSLVKTQTSDSFVVRAEIQDHKFRIDHIDTLSLVVDNNLTPFLKVEGRVCLQIETNGWCDILNNLFSLPSDNFQVELKADENLDILEVFLNNDGKLIPVGESIWHNEEFQTIKVNENIILFYDEQNNVPAVMLLEAAKESYKERLRKAIFNRLHN